MADKKREVEGFYPAGQEREVFVTSEQYGPVDNFYRSVLTDTWMGELYLNQRAHAEAIESLGPVGRKDPTYNPITDPVNKGYEQYVVESTSPQESFAIRYMVDKNQMLKREMEFGGAGVSRFLSAFVDPLTYTPVPIAKGLGFVKGMQKSAPAVVGSVAASELARHGLDPTSTPEETMIAIGAGTVLGAALGGFAGSIGADAGKGVGKGARASYKETVEVADQVLRRSDAATEAEAHGLHLYPDMEDKVRFSEITGEMRHGEKWDGTERVPGAFHRRNPDGSTKEILIDRERLIKDFNDKAWLSPKTKGVIPLSRDFRTPDEYIEFVIAHEKSHQKFPQLPGEEKWVYENRINNEALKEVDAAKVRREEAATKLEAEGGPKPEVPQSMKEEQEVAKARLEAREKEIAGASEQIAILRKEAQELRDRADTHETKSVRTRFRNKAKKIDDQVSRLEAQAEQKTGTLTGMKNDLDSINTRIDEIENARDVEHLVLKRAGGLESIRTEQLPWYRLINTKLRELAPELAADWMRMAHKIAGSPGLVTKGAVLGQAVPVSVEMLAKQWHQRYRVAMEENNKIYMRYLEKAQDPTRMQATLERGKQVLGGPFGMAQPPEGKMSALEFRQAVSSSLMNNDEAADPFIAEAVAVWRPIFDKFEQAGKETGVFRTIEKARADVQKHEMNLETAKQEEITKIEGQLESARSSLEALERSDLTTDKFFHRMIRQDKLEDPVLRERLEGVLRAHFMDKPYHYVNGKRMDFSTHPDHVEARVRETIAEMYREASFNDSLGLIDKGNKLERYENRIKTLQEDLKTASNKEKGILEHQIQIIQNKIDKGVGHGKGGPSPVLTRKLDIPTKDIAFILEDDVEMVMQHYVLKMAPVVEMARKFGDFRIDGEISRLTQKIDEVIAANPEKADALTKEKEVLVQAAEDLRDKVLGVYGIPNNPDALHNRAIRSLKAYNVLTLMGKAWMAALADSGKVVMSEGFTNTFGGLIKSASERLEKGRNSEWFMSGKEVEMAGEALDIAMATRMNQMSEMGGSYHGMTKLERWFQQQQGPFFFVNLLSAWTDNIKRFSGSLIQSRMIEDAVLWSEGKLPAERIERLAAIGMSEQWAKRFTRQWKEAGSQKGEHLFLANTTEWTDQEAVTFFRAMLATEVDNAVITPGAADKFNFMGKPFGSMLMQYRGFGLSATQRILMSGLQKKDMSTLAGAVSMISIAFMVDYARRPDYAEMDMKDMVFRAVERSGIAGIFSDINGALEVASGGQLGLRPMMGIQQIVSDPNWAQRTGAVAGPVTNQWLQLVHAVSDPSATENEQARAIRYMIPYNNLWFWSDTFTRAQRTLQEQLEE